MSVKKIELFKKVASSELCNRCGSCVGLSGGKVIFSDKTGKYKPVVASPITDGDAELFLQSCAGWSFNFPEYNKTIYNSPSVKHNVLTGSYQSIKIGHCNDDEVRLRSASGGILSSVLIFLLEKGEIDGAVVLRMSEKEPWLTEPFIATTREEVLEAAQSKYIISSVNEILPEICDFKGNLAYVGLPGQVQSLRKLQAIGHPSVRNIKYFFGPFYGNTLHFSSIRSFLRSYGEKDYRAIKKLYFRYGEWPGRMRIEMRSGRVIELPKVHANYLIPFHIMKNSLLCTDLTNEFTDLSGGDAWAPVYEERGKGFSMIIARSSAGQRILERMVDEGRLTVWDIDESEAIKMHSHGYDLKKRGTFIRLRFRKWFGMRNPDYGYILGDFPMKRVVMEVIVNAMFVVMGTRLARFAVELIPPSVVGGVFEKARTVWKKKTHKIKRSQL